MRTPDDDAAVLSRLKNQEVLLLRALLAAAAGLLVAGLVAPMMTVSKFVVVQNTFSVLSGLLGLLERGQYLLFAVLVGFSVVLPVLKIHVLFRLLGRAGSDAPRTHRYLALMHTYGRWAMLDVMVVAILIVAVKLGAIASIEVHVGIYLFGAAVLLIMLITERVVHRHRGAG